MSQELQKQEENKLSLLSQQTKYAQNLAKLQTGEVTIQEYSQTLALAKINDTLEAPHAIDVERELGTEVVLSIIFNELMKVNKMLNVDARLKLSSDQCSDIAIMVLEEFPHESFEDFVLAFRKGITGRYEEKLLRLDVQVIFRWIRAHLEEKAEYRESKLKESKQEELKPLTDEEKANIKKIIDESWVGEFEKKKQSSEEDYMKFKAELARKNALKAKKQKK